MKLNRAYAVLTVKAAEDDRREITGVATTPTPDRVGDIIEPMGVSFKNPLPLLHQHNSREPVGTVRFDKPTEEGVTFRATLPKIEEPGPLRDRIETAWGEIKAGLVRGVSIGFRSKEESFMDDGGIRFIETEVLELSLVTIPANAEATIQTIKSIDGEALAASGKQREAVSDPGVSGKSKDKPKPKKGVTRMKTIKEQIAAFEAKRDAAEAEMKAIMDEAAEAEEALDGEQAKEYDALKASLKAINEHIERLRDHEKTEAAKAAPVNGNDQEAASASRGGAAPRISVKEPKLEPGVPFARLVKCLGLARGNHFGAIEVAKRLYPNHAEIQAALLKATVGAATTGGATWAGPLVPDESGVFADFVEYLRPQTIVGKFGQNGIPALRRVPFRVGLVSQTSGGDGYWVGEAKAKPLTKFDFSRQTLEPLKVAAITVATMELLRDSNPAAEAILRDQLAAAVINRMDADFIDPESGAVAGVKPAAITNGITPITATGTDADAIRADIASAMSGWITANNRPTAGVWIMSALTALKLSLMMNALGQREFPDVDINGGRFLGFPVITTEHVTDSLDSPGQGKYVVFINASDIYFADEGEVAVDMSTEASLEMSDAPAQASDTPTAAQMVSMFQTNSVAFRAERTVNWMRRRSEAVVVIQDVTWGNNA